MERETLFAVVAIVVVLTASSCGGGAAEPTAMPAPTNTPEPAGRATDTPEPTAPPTNTAEPSAPPIETPGPSETTEPSPTSEVGEDVIRVDVGESRDRGGVVITIEAVALAPYDAMPEEFKSFTQDTDYWGDAQTVGAFEITVDNTTDQTINVHPAQGVVVVGSEQVNTALFMSDDVGGEVMAGVLKEGAVMFGLKRQAPQDVTSVRYVVDGPFDQDLSRLGEDYEFKISIAE